MELVIADARIITMAPGAMGRPKACWSAPTHARSRARGLLAGERRQHDGPPRSGQNPGGHGRLYDVADHEWSAAVCDGGRRAEVIL